MNKEFQPGGDKQSLDLDVRSGMDQYVHLALKDKHPMEKSVLSRKPSVKLVNLVIDRKILERSGVVFSTGIAYAQGVQIMPLEEAVEKELIDLDVLYGGLPWTDPDVQARLKIAEKCEILVPDFIPISFIRNFPNG